VIPARAVAVLVAAAVLASGCSAADDPAGERREVVATLTEAANAGDAGGVRRHADRLVEVVRSQLADEQVEPEQAERLMALARSVRAGADAIDVDLQQRLEAEAEAEAARKELEEAQRRLEEERRKAEEAAKKAEEERKGEDEGKGKGGDGEGDKKDEDKDD
jgi:hypothetical protein